MDFRPVRILNHIPAPLFLTFFYSPVTFARPDGVCKILQCWIQRIPDCRESTTREGRMDYLNVAIEWAGGAYFNFSKIGKRKHPFFSNI